MLQRWSPWGKHALSDERNMRHRYLEATTAEYAAAGYDTHTTAPMAGRREILGGVVKQRYFTPACNQRCDLRQGRKVNESCGKLPSNL